MGFEETFKEYAGYPDLSGVKKILVISMKRIGDVILTTPVYEVLKEHFPDSIIDVSVYKGTEEILYDNPRIRMIHVIQSAATQSFFQKIKSRLKFIISVRRERYDLVISLTTGHLAQQLAYYSGAKIRVGPIASKKYFNYSVDHAPMGRHYVERNLDNLRRIGLFSSLRHCEEPFGSRGNLSLKKTIIYPNVDSDRRISLILKTRNFYDFIVVHPTSKWMFKAMHPQKMAELIFKIQTELKKKVVLVGGSDAFEKLHTGTVIEHLSSSSCHLNDKEKSHGDKAFLDLSGILSLRELAALIRRSRLFIGVDSAPMHMACAVGTPCIALFGPTSEVDWGPWGTGHSVIVSSQYTCRPCNRDGCGGGKKSECLESISLEVILDQIRTSLL